MRRTGIKKAKACEMGSRNYVTVSLKSRNSYIKKNKLRMEQCMVGGVLPGCSESGQTRAGNVGNQNRICLSPANERNKKFMRKMPP